MPSILTHKSIMLLARERLADIRDRLQHKISTGLSVTDLEFRVWYLAGKAYDMMSENDASQPSIEFPTGGGYNRPLGQGVSRFSVMGSMGPDITGLAGLLAPGSAWVFDVVHKGTPDAQREAVLALSTDLTLKIWTGVSAAIDARPVGSPSDTNAKETARARMRAYVLGHLCHVAGDVLVHPYVSDLEWHTGTSLHSKFSHDRAEDTIEARVAQQVLRRESTREGQDWSVWWPTTGEVPAEFFDAYDAALEQIYHVRSARPQGFAAFEKQLQEWAPPPPDAALVKDGYNMLRHGVIAIGYGWGWWTWWAFLIPAVVPLMAMMPLAFAMPHGGRFLTGSPGDAGERGFFEVFMLPMAVSSIIPLFYGFYAMSLTTRGIESIAIWGGVSAVVNVLAAIVFFATLGVEDMPWWARWFFLFGIPAAFGIGFLVTAIANNKPGRTGKLLVTLLFALPFMITVAAVSTFALCAWLPEALGASSTVGAVLFGILTGLFIIAVGIAWFVLPKKARDFRIREQPEPFPADRRHFVRLFDDTTLFHDPATAQPTLAQRFFPSDGRELLKLWWDGGGELYVRSRRLALEFSFTGSGAPSQVVQVPLSPMTAAQFGDYLTRTVKDGSNATGHLKTAMANADLAYELPSGATFSDEGDVAEAADPARYSAALQTEESDRWRQLGTSQDNTSYILHHAPKSLQATRFGHTGAQPFDPREPGVFELPGHVSSAGTTVTGDGTFFQNFFIAGDRIQATGQARVITLIRSQTELVVASAFSPDLPAGTSFQRVGPETEDSEGYDLVMDPAGGVVGGRTLMDFAADFGALLCLGATPHLLPGTELRVPDLATKRKADNSAADASVAKIYQVFRNWNLDRRRINEWRMIVHGGAVTEKAGVPTTYDATMPTPQDPDWRPGPGEGERVMREQGWVPLLRKWLAMAGDVAQNAADPGAANAPHPTNQELSRGLAFLLDMPDPVLVH